MTTLIFYQYYDNCVLKYYVIFVPLKEKKSATIPKHIKDFPKNKKVEITFCKMIITEQVPRINQGKGLLLF